MNLLTVGFLNKHFKENLCLDPNPVLKFLSSSESAYNTSLYFTNKSKLDEEIAKIKYQKHSLND